MKMFARTAATLILAACGTAFAAEPGNFVTWRPGLASAGQPDAPWLAGVKRAGYDVIVNLAPPQAHGSLENEGGIVGSKGVTYVHIPVDFSAPTAEDFRFFSEVLKANAARKVFVHCEINLRGSAFTFLYRVIHEKAPLSETMARMTGVWAPNPTWKKFIESTLAAHGIQAEIL